MRTVLVTGGSGFFGQIMSRYLAARDYLVINIDLVNSEFQDEHMISYKGDIRDIDLLEKVFSSHQIDAVIHLAAMLAHERKMIKELWSSNVDGTRNIMDMCVKYNIDKIVFTSSNCLWGRNFDYPVTEEEEPAPVEIYGRSKLEGEKILSSQPDKVKSVIIRCPTIMDEGRLGLLAILFEFVDDNKKLWLVGNGENRYQFIYAKDLAKACELSLDYNQGTVFNIGSDDVKSFNYTYQYVVDHSESTSRLAHFPPRFAKFMMKACYFLGISPLGVYQYNMISSTFVFDTSKIKRELGWKPTMMNEDMLLRSYEYYHKNREEIHNRKDVSAHNREADMGLAIRVLKFFS